MPARKPAKPGRKELIKQIRMFGSDGYTPAGLRAESASFRQSESLFKRTDYRPEYAENSRRAAIASRFAAMQKSGALERIKLRAAAGRKSKASRKMVVANIKSLRKKSYSPEELRAASRQLSARGHKELALATRFSAMEKSGSLKRLKKNSKARR
ncbi:MAG: hypothetical protein Q7R70_03270 [Candidatus Diapherotrites archaeon]|nr:hypothetical protein [Candidatus Diapherotrites archaeon]